MTETAKRMLPTIHRNGTSKGELDEQYMTAARAVQDAIRAVQAASPNARDYYVQGPEAAQAAIREHSKRLELLNTVLMDLQAIWEHIVEA